MVWSLLYPFLYILWTKDGLTCVCSYIRNFKAFLNPQLSITSNDQSIFAMSEIFAICCVVLKTKSFLFLCFFANFSLGRTKIYAVYLYLQNKTYSKIRLNDKKLNDTTFQYSDLLLQSRSAEKQLQLIRTSKKSK